MFRRRLRPLPSPEELSEIYATPHDHRKYGYGHYLRVQHTITLGQWAVLEYGLNSGTDLSCGNGEILKNLPLRTKIYGDFAPGYQYTGPIEETLERVSRSDLFVISETIEHLDDPDTVLKRIREKARYLLLSTPIGEDDLGNREHLWGFDEEAVELMLNEAGWETVARLTLLTPGHGYFYQCYVCQ